MQRNKRLHLALATSLAIAGSLVYTTAVSAAKPYVWAIGDVSVGQGMGLGGEDCAIPANPMASAVGWEEAQTSNPLYDIQPHFTSASTSAVFALNHIQDFFTRSGHVPSRGPLLPPVDLAFANNAAGQVNLTTGIYGGKFAGGKCIADAFAGATNVQKGDFKLSQLAGMPAAGAGNTINLADGQKLKFYVEGDLYIDRNIDFGSPSYRLTSDIPLISIIVKGNVYIDHNVNFLTGVFNVQPTNKTANNGIIYTCATDSAAPFTPLPIDKNLYDSCNVRLQVEGTMTARQIQLMRTYGPVISNYYGPDQDLVTHSELFEYSPLIWLANQAGTSKFAPSKYDSITSLPPVL